jgi:lysophospholipase L1-like esterase
MRRLPLLLVAVAALLLPAAVARAATPLPNSMASTGDSITRGFDATLFGCFLADCPQDSWSTGNNSTVDSQYLRIRAVNPAVTAYNDAKTGAKMSALDGQLATAAGQHVDYVTVLMGANDVCTSSAATMTPTGTFSNEFQTALSDFFAADPNAHVFVSSIPNVYQLWSLLHTNRTATSTWKSFNICQSMLSSANTETQRQAVLAQEKSDNGALASVCGGFPNCLWDGGATFDYVFTTSDVSTVDYFHPSVTGQKHLAGKTWAASYWPAQP